MLLIQLGLSGVLVGFKDIEGYYMEEGLFNEIKKSEIVELLISGIIIPVYSFSTDRKQITELYLNCYTAFEGNTIIRISDFITRCNYSHFNIRNLTTDYSFPEDIPEIIEKVKLLNKIFEKYYSPNSVKLIRSLENES